MLLLWCSFFDVKNLSLLLCLLAIFFLVISYVVERYEHCQITVNEKQNKRAPLHWIFSKGFCSKLTIVWVGILWIGLLTQTGKSKQGNNTYQYFTPFVINNTKLISLLQFNNLKRFPEHTVLTTWHATAGFHVITQYEVCEFTFLETYFSLLRG